MPFSYNNLRNSRRILQFRIFYFEFICIFTYAHVCLVDGSELGLQVCLEARFCTYCSLSNAIKHTKLHNLYFTHETKRTFSMYCKNALDDESN